MKQWIIFVSYYHCFNFIVVVDLIYQSNQQLIGNANSNNWFSCFLTSHGLSFNYDLWLAVQLDSHKLLYVSAHTARLLREKIKYITGYNTSVFWENEIMQNTGIHSFRKLHSGLWNLNIAYFWTYCCVFCYENLSVTDFIILGVSLLSQWSSCPFQVPVM